MQRRRIQAKQVECPAGEGVGAGEKRLPSEKLNLSDHRVSSVVRSIRALYHTAVA